MRLPLLHSLLALALFLGLIAPTPTNAQVVDTAWIHTYGGEGQEYLRDMIALSDGGYLMVGAIGTVSNGAADVYLVKIDSALNYVWSKAFGYDNIDWATGAAELPDGRVLISGYSNSIGQGDYQGWLLTLDANGNTPPAPRQFGGQDWDLLHDVAVRDDGSCVLVGETYSFGNGSSDMWVIMVNQFGIEQWSATLGGPEEERATAVAALPDGRIAVVGEVRHKGAGMADMILAFYNEQGDTLSTHTYGGAADDGLLNVTPTANNQLLLAGYTESQGAAGRNLAFVKVDSLGNEIFTRVFGGPAPEECTDIAELASGDLIVLNTGSSFGSGGSGFYTFRTNSSGWTNGGPTYGGQQDEDTRTIIVTPNNEVLFAGSTESYGAGFSDFCVIRIDDDTVHGTFEPVVVPHTDNAVQLFTAVESEPRVWAAARAFPNPMSERTTLSWPNMAGHSSRVLLELYDYTGRLVRQELLRTENPIIERGELRPGIYIGRLSDDVEHVAQFKIVVQ